MRRTVILYNATDPSLASQLWQTDGTTQGTVEITTGFSANVNGLDPLYLTAFAGKVLFEGQDTSGKFGLWVTNGTAAGTREIGGIGSTGINGANPGGLQPQYLQVYGGEVLFEGMSGLQGSPVPGLWVTNGTA